MVSASSEQMTSDTPTSKPSWPELVIVTGMSSAGRSTAANVLEDLGWYVVDNLPPQMLNELLDLAARGGGTGSGSRPTAGIAAVVDVRSRSFFQALQDALFELRTRGANPRVVFLDAADDVLVRRQESVRRPHPLQGDGRILDAVHQERLMLEFVRENADVVIDTSGLNVTQLRSKVSQVFDTGALPALRATVMSFGFKYGVPLDADFVLDMRFLPNPHWVEELRPQTGLDAPVSEYVLAQSGADVFLDRFVSSLEPVLVGYEAESKRYMTIAVGCTGGKHRSVAMTTALATRLAALGVQVGTLHRDLGRE
ncbi:RNase adapter RapZ [Angustibacter sp. Root456]|uniref:RNase adapter RapZ n=1 Tax=Angustibacter sp. Root456 TaxID=1736539 RepID=UPI003512FBBB